MLLPLLGSFRGLVVARADLVVERAAKVAFPARADLGQQDHVGDLRR
jgi:hypothetical protein